MSMEGYLFTVYRMRIAQKRYAELIIQAEQTKRDEDINLARSYLEYLKKIEKQVDSMVATKVLGEAQSVEPVRFKTSQSDEGRYTFVHVEHI